MWAALLGMEAMAVGGAGGLVWRLAPAPRRARWTALTVGGLCLALLLYDWLQVQG
jgi:hypothetical protein